MLTDDVSTTGGDISSDSFQLLLSEDTDGGWMSMSATSWCSHSQSLYQCHCIKLTQESFGGGCVEERHRSASEFFRDCNDADSCLNIAFFLTRLVQNIYSLCVCECVVCIKKAEYEV